MPIVGTSAKGQVLIPAALRKRIGLRPGGKALVTLADGNRVLIAPVPEDPIEAACGLLKGGPSLTKALLEERRKDREREDKKAARLIRADRISRKGGRVRNRPNPAA